MKCGLLGRKLSHSYSPQIHSMLGDYPYELFETEPDHLESFLKNGDFTGINVTIPYKKEVIPYLDELSPVAQKLGAVNTIIKRRDGSLFGHNTDYAGFHAMVKNCGAAVNEKKILVLGSGGASNTATAVLEELGGHVTVISRSGKNSYATIDRHSDAAIIVNTTPVGMFPTTEKSPVDLSRFPNLEAVLDVIYNPARTKLLQDAENLGVITENGLRMLVAQAKEAAEYFTENTIPNDRIQLVHKTLSLQMENIILIGMPGCGKSTVGKLLAEQCGKTFVDADAEIIALAGKSIPEIFADGGEPGFRKLETKVLDTLGKQSGLVIATGGGCVTQVCNYPLLHQNGRIFWLKRSLNLLPTEGRPLSQTKSLADMYAVRKPLYNAFSDHAVDNSGTPNDTVAMILSLLEEME